ncbi:MAG TPA: hypothetical protein VLE70_12645 [Anaerolineae bacterium]|nr:hypothetical protein [Anaerolineae bacterium]
MHHDLKQWCARPADRLEVVVDGYEVDVVGHGRLVEVQTGSFSALKAKLAALLPDYPVQVVYPIAKERWICRVDDWDRPISRRKSPKRGRIEELFGELLRLPETAVHPNFSLLVLLTQEEVVWRDDGRGSWRRRGWSVADRRLLAVLDETLFNQPADYQRLIPADLHGPFTNRDLAESLAVRRPLATKMTYCLRRMDLLEQVGKRGRFNLYQRIGTAITE